MTSSSQWNKSQLVLFFSFLLMMSLAVWTNVQVRSLGVAWVEAPREATEKWNPTLFKAMTVGHWPVAVDWLWIRAIQDPAIMHVQVGKHAAFFYDMDLGSDLDPGFSDFYNHGATLLSIIRNDNEGALILLNKGNRFRKEQLSQYPASFQEEYWYRSWWIPLTMGYIYMYEVQDLPKAAQAIKEAAEISGSPEYLDSLQQRLQSREGQYEVGLRVLEHWANSARDPRMKTEFQRRGRNLEMSRDLYRLNEKFKQFVSRKKTSLAILWAEFKKNQGLFSRDPWGGEWILTDDGQISTTAPHEPVFGIK